MSGRKGNWQTMQAPSNTSSFTVYMLKPDTMYQFKILSRNQYGNGTYSETIEGHTLGMFNVVITL